MGMLTNGLAICEPITDNECLLLNSLLVMARSNKQPTWLRSFLGYFRIWAGDGEPNAKYNVDLGDILHALLQSATEVTAEGAPAFYGCLYDIHNAGPQIIEPEEYKELLKYLEVLRSRSWLSSFIQVECDQFAKDNSRTPIDTARTLAGTELEEFQVKTDIAKDMLELHPDLFKDEIARLNARTPAAAPIKASAA